MIGDKYGRLTVIKDLGCRKRVSTSAHRVQHVQVKCDCGSIKDIALNDLKAGKTKSCGCYNMEQIIDRATKHGKSDTRIYSIWKDMRKRCNNKNATNYSNYGGRGIKVCTEWDNFEEFYNWSMDNGYNENLSIDRIDFNGDYEPNNCRWTTSVRQNRNTRKNKPFVGVSPDGTKHKGFSQADFADKHNLDRKAISTCLNGRQKTHKGWSFYFI